MRENGEKLLMPEGQIERIERDDCIAPELQDRSDYESALETLRRFDRMIEGSEEPMRILRENTRGTWTRSSLSRT